MKKKWYRIYDISTGTPVMTPDLDVKANWFVTEIDAEGSVWNLIDRYLEKQFTILPVYEYWQP